MEIKVHGKHTQVSDSLERFAAEKLSRLNKYLPSIRLIDVEFYEEGRSKGGSHIAEVAVATKGSSFRARTAAADYRAAIDIAVDRLSRQICDFKEKSSARPRHAKPAKVAAPSAMLDLTALNAEVAHRQA